MAAESESGKFMEVIKAAWRSSSAENIAVRADQKSYTYTQLISSAVNISSLLSSTKSEIVCFGCISFYQAWLLNFMLFIVLIVLVI